MYSVSVRSEKWKLNLLINFRFSEVYGREGKMRFSEVSEEGKVEHCIKEKFDVVCQNLSYKFDVMKFEEEEL